MTRHTHPQFAALSALLLIAGCGGAAAPSHEAAPSQTADETGQTSGD